MNKIARFVVRRRRLLMLIFALFTLASAVCIPFVRINYDDTAYLPADSNTKIGLSRMEQAFSGGGSAICMAAGADMEALLSAKAAILSIDGVQSVFWLDDALFPMAEGGFEALSASSLGATREQGLSALTRALMALRADPSETAGSALNRIKEALSPEEMQIALIMLQNMRVEGFDFSLSAGALTLPLGDAYAAGMRALQAQIQAFYTGDNALFQLIFENGDYDRATARALREIEALPYDLVLGGNAAATYDSQRNITREVLIGSVAAGVVVLVVLTLFSAAWIEPIIYIVAIGASVVLNMGTNLLSGSVSYLTNSIACILQMVLSIDYAIFLLSRYKRERASGLMPEDAMRRAFTRCFAPVSASSLTTLACFVTIMFMRFRMGADMGFVLGKGILCSLLGVFLLLPELVIRLDGALTKTGHRAINLEGGGLSRFVYRRRYVIILLAALLAVPGIYGAARNSFTYGASATQGADSLAVINRRKIEAVFGRQEPLAILVPKTDDAAEAALAQALSEEEEILSVNSYAAYAQSGQAALLPEETRAQLDGDGWRRIVLMLDAEEEGPQTARLIARVRARVEEAYGDGAEHYLLGNTAAAIDMQDCTREDYGRISWYSLIAVALIVGLTFKSPLLAVLLVAVIEAGIRINMAIPYFRGQQMAFIGYMIIVNILLGSTIDYAILVTENYMEARRTQDVKESVSRALSQSLGALCTSAGIFALGGAVVAVFMSSSTVKLIGNAILRGGVCAFALTVFALPALLAACDRWVQKSVIRRKHAPGDK